MKVKAGEWQGDAVIPIYYRQANTTNSLWGVQFWQEWALAVIISNVHEEYSSFKMISRTFRQECPPHGAVEVLGAWAAFV